MTAATFERTTESAGEIPSKGTLPMAANTRVLRGTIACVDADGRAVAGTDGSGLNAVGKFAESYANLTTSSSGGAAGAIDAEIQYGVFGWNYTGTAPKAGQVVYVVDNQTVSIDSDSGQRGIAGYCSELIEGQCWVWMGPHVVAQIVIAATEASQLDTAQTDIDALQANALTANATLWIPFNAYTADDGTPLAKFADSSSATFGLNVADSEALCVRWNNHATPGTIRTTVSLPPDLDDTAAAQLEFLCSKTGATAGDATILTVAAYIITAGDLHDADSNCGGDTGALTGNATAKTTAVLSRTLAAADIPENARLLNITVTPKAGTLGTDDLLMHETRLRYTKKMLVA
jgi:hypothetical protein